MFARSEGERRPTERGRKRPAPARGGPALAPTLMPMFPVMVRVAAMRSAKQAYPAVRCVTLGFVAGRLRRWGDATAAYFL